MRIAVAGLYRGIAVEAKGAEIKDVLYFVGEPALTYGVESFLYIK